VKPQLTEEDVLVSPEDAVGGQRVHEVIAELKEWADAEYGRRTDVA
jgi:hypothetical protein